VNEGDSEVEIRIATMQIKMAKTARIVVDVEESGH
jgi:hypothetical protein